MAVGARLLLGLLVVLALPACGHGGPTEWNATSHELCQNGNCYRVGDLGAGWQEVKKEGASVGFYNAELGAVLQANSTCRNDIEAAPLESLTRQLLIGYTMRETLWQDHFLLDGRDALRTRVNAQLDGVPVALDVVVMRRNGCLYDLSYVAPPKNYERGKPEFLRFVHGFADLRRPKS